MCDIPWVTWYPVGDIGILWITHDHPRDILLPTVYVHEIYPLPTGHVYFPRYMDVTHGMSPNGYKWFPRCAIVHHNIWLLPMIYVCDPRYIQVYLVGNNLSFVPHEICKFATRYDCHPRDIISRGEHVIFPPRDIPTRYKIVPQEIYISWVYLVGNMFISLGEHISWVYLVGNMIYRGWIEFYWCSGEPWFSVPGASPNFQNSAAEIH